MLYVLITIMALFVIREFLPNQYTSANISSMILLPFIMKGNFKATTAVFVSTNFVQTMTLEIRNISLMVSDFNFATLTILMIDYYILEVLFYFLFNHNKEI